MLGVDVSRWQGDIDWPAVRQARRDVRFAIVRLAEWRVGSEGVDAQAAANLDGAQSAGLAVGTYCRVEPTLHTAEEAAVQWRAYRTLFGADRPGWLVPAFDIEDHSQDWSAWVRKFIEYSRRMAPAALGNRLIIYTSGSFVESAYPTGWSRTDTRISLWVGHTGVDPGATPYLFAGRTSLHQYSHTTQIHGIGQVDMNSTVGAWSLIDLMI